MSFKTLTAYSFAAICSISILLSCIGGVLNFSSIPYWDMWEGSIGFIQDFHAGDWSKLFAQHNEHRIFLSRLLFFIEYDLLGGSGAFLIIMNYVFVLIASLVFWQTLKWLNEDEISSGVLLLAGLGLLTWLSLWKQSENLTWGFQSQFFLAQLLPLISLICLSRSDGGELKTDRWFWLGLGFGILSVGTMANGLLVQPLLVAFAVITRLGRVRSILLGVVAVSMFTLYLTDYHRPGHHPSVLDTLVNHPIGFVKYALCYLGSPFEQFFHGDPLPWYAYATLGGGLFVAACWEGIRRLLTADEKRTEMALIFFIGFISLTAFVTSGGRFPFGLETAFSSRYATPALMAWAALFVLYSPKILWVFDEYRGEMRTASLGAILLASVVLISQRQALRPDTGLLVRRSLAGLALELQVRDDSHLRLLYPVPARVMDRANWASSTDVSVFGREPYRDLKEEMGAPAEILSDVACLGSLDSVSTMVDPSGDQEEYVRLRGWVFDSEKKKVPKFMRIVSDEGLLVGIIVTGEYRADVEQLIHPKAARSGYFGFLKRTHTARTVHVAGKSCTLEIKLPEAFPWDASN